MTKKKRLGEEPAFPRAGGTSFGGEYWEAQDGMSKRFFAACSAMRGLISANPKYLQGTQDVPFTGMLIKISFEYADELLKKESE